MYSRIITIVGAVGLLVAGAYVYATSYLVARDLRTAAESGDQVALEELVDFDRVRQSLREQIMAKVMSEFTYAAGSGHSDAEMAGMAFGTALLPGIVDSMLDGLVSPAGLARLFEERRPEGGDRVDADAGEVADPFKSAELEYKCWGAS